MPKRKVFGVGLSRTGTSSLSVALTMLGYRSVHYPLFLVKNTRPLSLNVEKVYSLDAITDIPASRFYRELEKEFPDALFILTTRDIDEWVLSIERLKPLYSLLRYYPKVEQLFYEVYGTREIDIHTLQSAYHTHNEEVRSHFQHKKNFLEFQVTQGWGPLCDFLGCEIPQRDFPWVNNKMSTSLKNVLDFLGIY